MSFAQNLSYSIVQAAHNFGAVAVVGGSLSAVMIRETEARKIFTWIVLAGWALQAVSGATFGAVSFYFYHQFPDISGVAWVALIVKMVCVVIGLLLLGTYLFSGANWESSRINLVWGTSSMLAITALSAAAILRWFS
jgi:hypothetical protein